MRSGSRWWWLLGVCALLPACAGGPATDDALPPRAPTEPQAFQAAEAWRHLEALAGLGFRTPGSEAAARARERVAAELAELGLPTREIAFEGSAEGSSAQRHLLLAEVPGAAGDLLVVASRVDTGSEALAAAGSGAAIALELARLVAAVPLPYTTWFVFHEGGPDAADALARQLLERGSVEQVRLVLLLGPVCATQLSVARDLLSHRVYREEFFAVARRLGLAPVFDAEAAFETVEAGQSQLATHGLRRFVVLAAAPRVPAPGADAEPGVEASAGSLAACSPENLDAVGRVAWAGLRDIAARLHRIDRFSAVPVAAPPEPGP